MPLERFHQAQARDFEAALSEIRAGRKRSHWIWYIFPQIAGLGHSPAARDYALRDLDETRAYLRDPILFARYRQITAAIVDKLAEGASLESLMGSRIDALKLVSSLTLFRAAACELEGDEFQDLARQCETVLQAAAGQGFPACQFTLQRCVSDAGRERAQKPF